MSTPSAAADETAGGHRPRLFLARHAERSAFARTGQWDQEASVHMARAWDDALTSEGVRQAAVLAAQLPAGAIRRVVASNWLRCFQTAAVVARTLQVPLFVDPALGEFEREAWFGSAGVPPRQLAQQLPHLLPLLGMCRADTGLGIDGQFLRVTEI